MSKPKSSEHKKSGARIVFYLTPREKTFFEKALKNYCKKISLDVSASTVLRSLALKFIEENTDVQTNATSPDKVTGLRTEGK